MATFFGMHVAIGGVISPILGQSQGGDERSWHLFNFGEEEPSLIDWNRDFPPLEDQL
jgi:hypothetical protein